MITRENYEEHFLDYFDGILSEKEVEELLRFLSLNTDLEDEFYLLMQQTSEVNLSSDDFSSLIVKRESKIGYELSSFDYLCVADLEHDITEEETRILEDSIQTNSKLKGDYLIYQKTRLEEEPIVCLFKNELKKNVFVEKGGKTRRIASYSSVAAAVLLVFYLAYNETDNLKVADDVAKKIEVVAPRSTNEVVKEMVKRPVMAEVSTSLSNKPAVLNKVKATAFDASSSSPLLSETKEKVLSAQTQVKEQLAYLQVDLNNVSVEPSKVATLASIPAAVENSASKEMSGSILSDNELAKSVADFLDKAKGETSQLTGTIEEVKGRKRGVFIGKLISGVNTILGTDMQYSSRYTSDGKLVAVSFEVGKLNYSKKYDDEK